MSLEQNVQRSSKLKRNFECLKHVKGIGEDDDEFPQRKCYGKQREKEF
jgi:hypothetical protein